MALALADSPPDDLQNEEVSTSVWACEVQESGKPEFLSQAAHQEPRDQVDSKEALCKEKSALRVLGHRDTASRAFVRHPALALHC